MNISSFDPHPIDRDEYVARQDRARLLARERGYDALIAWARGGGAQDRYADVYYLSGYYTQQPFVPDLFAEGKARWRATGHAAVVVPVDGPVTLIADADPEPDHAQATDTTTVTSDVVAAVIATLQDTRVRAVGVLGGDALPARWFDEIRSSLASTTVLREADDIASALRTIKRPCELDFLRAAGRLGSRAMTVAMNAAIPGATEADVSATLVAEIVRHGGAFYGMGISSGARAHTFAPSGGGHGSAAYGTTVLREGDILRLDAYGSVSGYLFDFARTRVVGRRPSREQRELIEAVRDSVTAGIEAIRPGETLGAVARKCNDVLAQSAYARRNRMPASTMDGAWGHGLGLAFEPPWIEPTSSVVIDEGMCLAVERRIEARDAPPGLGGAQYEENVLVTESGIELLSQTPTGFGE